MDALGRLPAGAQKLQAQRRTQEETSLDQNPT